MCLGMCIPSRIVHGKTKWNPSRRAASRVRTNSCLLQMLLFLFFLFFLLFLLSNPHTDSIADVMCTPVLVFEIHC
ncbi:uncharacterized protein BO66DRAFT_219396 [Aspergillus aculeatinus CBS 121060]|uniref:Uncharacterized protein n=1 Tax=Aspergillus aculeatinus CBS 121060 TaxID=1448322 RepID=A0ACD1GUA4_9EURO|nr:hypothetical protein BO66DRAFT_219396 [Aspergillus aculeatinus CBS 121060]RAH65039.1 hypothetical protein BO66DRAFT_219396 [Aspergillus aculeatinus CBS 121060]